MPTRARRESLGHPSSRHCRSRDNTRGRLHSWSLGLHPASAEQGLAWGQVSSLPSVLGLGGAPSSRWWEGGWEPALACPSWQDGDSHGSGSSDFISAEAGTGASHCLNATRATGREEGSPDSASHNTAFLPASRAGRSWPACSTLPAARSPVSGSGLLLSTQKAASLSIHVGNFLVLPSPSVVFREGALSRSLQRCPLPAGTQWDADATQDLLSLPVLEAGEAVLAAEGQGGTESPEQLELPLAPRSGLAAAPRKVPGPVGPVGWCCSELGLLQHRHLHRGPCETSVTETADSQQERWKKRKGADGKTHLPFPRHPQLFCHRCIFIPGFCGVSGSQQMLWLESRATWPRRAATGQTGVSSPEKHAEPV